MSVVRFTLELAGDVSSFTPSVESQIKSAIAALAGVDPSAVELTISPGSVIVGVRITTPTATAAWVQSTMASVTSSPSSATAMLASVTGVSIAVLAVVTLPTIANVAPPPPTIANFAPPPPPQLIGALAVAAKTSGSIGTIIGVIIGVIIALVLALVFMRRRRHLNEKRRKDVGLQAPTGWQAEPDEKGATARIAKPEIAVEMAAPESKSSAGMAPTTDVIATSVRPVEIEVAAPEPEPTVATTAVPIQPSVTAPSVAAPSVAAPAIAPLQPVAPLAPTGPPGVWQVWLGKGFVTYDEPSVQQTLETALMAGKAVATISVRGADYVVSLHEPRQQTSAADPTKTRRVRREGGPPPPNLTLFDSLGHHPLYLHRADSSANDWAVPVEDARARHGSRAHLVANEGYNPPPRARSAYRTTVHRRLTRADDVELEMHGATGPESVRVPAMRSAAGMSVEPMGLVQSQEEELAKWYSQYVAELEA